MVICIQIAPIGSAPAGCFSSCCTTKAGLLAARAPGSSTPAAGTGPGSKSFPTKGRLWPLSPTHPHQKPDTFGSEGHSQASILNAKGIDNMCMCPRPYAQRTPDTWICVAHTIRLKFPCHQVTLPGHKLECFPMRQ